MRVLEPFFNGYDSNYSELRTRCRDILQQEDSLSEIVQLVGRDSLSEDQKVISGGRCALLSRTILGNVVVVCWYNMLGNRWSKQTVLFSWKAFDILGHEID